MTAVLRRGRVQLCYSHFLNHLHLQLPAMFGLLASRFCTGEMSEEEAFRAAIATWPTGIRPGECLHSLLNLHTTCKFMFGSPALK